VAVGWWYYTPILLCDNSFHPKVTPRCHIRKGSEGMKKAYKKGGTIVIVPLFFLKGCCFRCPGQLLYDLYSGRIVYYLVVYSSIKYEKVG
jgi:hypothetical protein